MLAVRSSIQIFAEVGSPLRSLFPVQRFVFWTGFVDAQCSLMEHRSVQSLNRMLGFRVIWHFDESETSRMAGITISDQGDDFNNAVCSKQVAQIVLGNGKIQIANVDVCHKVPSLGRSVRSLAPVSERERFTFSTTAARVAAGHVRHGHRPHARRGSRRHAHSWTVLHSQ